MAGSSWAADGMELPDWNAVLPGEEGLIDLVWTLGVAAVLAAAALIVHGVLVFVARRIARRTETGSDELLIEHLVRPLRWIAVALALLSIQRIAVPSRDLAAGIVAFVQLVMPLLWGWLLIAGIRFLKSYIYARSDLEVEDNLAARRRRTRADILARIAVIVVLLVSAGLMLLSIPAVREIGVAVMASAGIAGLAAEAAPRTAVLRLAPAEQPFEQIAEIDLVRPEALETGRPGPRAIGAAPAVTRPCAHSGEGIGRVAIGIDLAAVILRALGLVREQVIGAGRLGEFLRGLGIVLVAIGVELLRQLAIGTLDVGLGGRAGYPERGIKVAHGELAR